VVANQVERVWFSIEMFFLILNKVKKKLKQVRRPKNLYERGYFVHKESEWRII